VRLKVHTWYVFSLAFSPDGETLVSGSGDSAARLWDAFAVARRLRVRRAAARLLSQIWSARDAIPSVDGAQEGR
jgi:WD40 repeat protein